MFYVLFVALKVRFCLIIIEQEVKGEKKTIKGLNILQV